MRGALVLESRADGSARAPSVRSRTSVGLAACAEPVLLASSSRPGVGSRIVNHGWSVIQPERNIDG
jgi:hypothetical protein